MRYIFSNLEMQALASLPLSFDPIADLSDEEELLLLEILSDSAAKVGYDTPEGDLYTDILDSMAKQAQ